jgi:hypothetical protein
MYIKAAHRMLMKLSPDHLHNKLGQCQTQTAVRATLLFLKREKSSVGRRFKNIEKKLFQNNFYANYLDIIELLIVKKFIYSLQIGQILSFFAKM